MAQYEALFRPLEIKGLRIRNRLMSTSHAPGYTAGGRLSERYARYHEEKAKGGIGLTQWGGASAVSVENSFHYGQLDATTDAIIPEYREMAARIHRHGAAVMTQLTHGGRRERWDSVNWLPAFAPSPRREPLHRSFPVELEQFDIDRIQDDFAQATRRGRDGGLDGTELAFSSLTLVAQFLSPLVNARTDRYGGGLANRMRFGLELLERVREAAGPDYIVGIRMSGDELHREGLSQEDSLAVGRAFAESGLIDFISVVGGQPSTIQSSAYIFPPMWVPPAPYLHLAGGIKAAVDIPIFHATRITDPATAARAIEDGHMDMVGMTRAFIADPHFANKLREGREHDIRQCVGASMCLERVAFGADALCIQNAATGREETMPHRVPQAPGGTRRVVVVGAGPGGLEAARVSAERGHAVVLFERAERTGGQINLAARATWRENLSGIPRWLDAQVRKLGVDLRLGTEAAAAAVLAEAPDIVVVATGGQPNKGRFEGAGLAQSTWDILGGTVEPAEDVLLFDDSGAHQGPSCAEFMAQRGARVEVATPERALGIELSEIHAGPHLTELYKKGVVISPDLRLVQLYREGNKLVAVLHNEYGDREEERVVDQVVAKHGTLPNDAIYKALQPHARNRGQTDLRALVAGRPQTSRTNPGGRFMLYRVGDAWASRNIHAAIYDSLRLCKEF